VRNLRHRAARLLAGLATVTGLLAATAAAASAVDAVPGPHLAEVNCTGTDWVEIANPGAEDVSLDGWALTDDSSPAAPVAFGTGDVVPAGGMLVVTASSEPMTGSLRLPVEAHARAVPVIGVGGWS
jgi:hypothetical protein